jgi:hypothetical protein
VSDSKRARGFCPSFVGGVLHLGEAERLARKCKFRAGLAGLVVGVAGCVSPGGGGAVVQVSAEQDV